MCELRHVWQCSSVTALSQLWLPLAWARGSEGTQRPVLQLPRLLPQQPQHKSHFKELQINFSELKTYLYFRAASLKVFLFCGKELMRIPPKFSNWWFYPLDTGSLMYAILWTTLGRWGQQMTWEIGTWHVWDTDVISCWTIWCLSFSRGKCGMYTYLVWQHGKNSDVYKTDSFSCITVHSRRFF